MKAGRSSLDGEVKILGAFFSHPYFMDKKDDPRLDKLYKIWDFVYPNAPGGSDCYMINPMGVGAPSLGGLGCGRVLVVVAEKDELRDSAVRYYDAVKKSGFEGVVELFEVNGEGHRFHAFSPKNENAKLVFKRLATFLSK